MEITVWWIHGKYAEVTIREGSGTLESGLLDKNERKDLITKLQNVIYDLSYGID